MFCLQIKTLKNQKQNKKQIENSDADLNVEAILESWNWKLYKNQEWNF